MDPAHFVEQFSMRNPDIADLPRLVACCVEWGERADNTFQNAQDTKCWAERRGLTGPLLLIHLPANNGPRDGRTVGRTPRP